MRSRCAYLPSRSVFSVLGPPTSCPSSTSAYLSVRRLMLSSAYVHAVAFQLSGDCSVENDSVSCSLTSLWWR